jgi:hypothetical protein
METIRNSVDNLSLTALKNVDLSAIEHNILVAVQTLQTAALALGIRICCAALLNSYMEDVQLRESRLNDCADLWRSLNQSSMDIQVTLNSKFDSLKEFLSLRRTEEEKKNRAKQRTHALFLDAARTLKMTKDDFGRVRSDRTVFSATTNPVELALTVGEDGRILEALVASSS